MTFDPRAIPSSAVADLRAHAIAEFPRESCGALTADGYVPFRNVADDPLRYFDCWDELKPIQVDGRLLALAHSHPSGPYGPSMLDMAQQIAMDVPWGIVVCDSTRADLPWWWSDDLAPPPLLGREFRHGPSGSDGRGDCYALIRDWYRLERDIRLEEFPRDDDWWRGAGDLYTTNFAAAGFRIVDRATPQIGDVVLMSLRTRDGKSNHGTVYVGDGKVLHHLPHRQSRIEPVGPWLRQVTFWLRHASAA